MKSTQYSSKREFLTSGLLLLAAIMLLACAQSTFAQWNASPSPSPNNNIYYNAGNVGIGTTNPGEKLTISSGALQMTNAASAPTAATGEIKLFSYDVFGNGATMVTRADDYLFTSRGGNSNYMYINPFGNVGIGTL